VCQVVQGFFDIQQNSGRRHTATEMQVLYTVSCFDVHESSTDLHVASSILQRAFGLFVK